MTSPSSFALELQIIYLWNQEGDPKQFQLTNALKKVMETIAYPDNIRVEFFEYYSREFRQRNHSVPYIIDPVNPYSNEAAKCRWDEISREAYKFLQKPLLKSATSKFI